MEEPQLGIRALHTASTITVYQAYPPEIGMPAVRQGRFPAAWKRDRMTWIFSAPMRALEVRRSVTAPDQ
jgi:hypothetical protein